MSLFIASSIDFTIGMLGFENIGFESMYSRLLISFSEIK